VPPTHLSGKDGAREIILGEKNKEERGGDPLTKKEGDSLDPRGKTENTQH